jgi:ribosomal protein S18 acetylase RimI-like enzyme
MHYTNFTIELITRDNYHLFDDMVYWRMKGVELTKEEKEVDKSSEFTEVYKELAHPGFYSYGAFCEGRFVGWISMMYTPKNARRRWKKGVIYIDELWTAPEFRRKGIASALMKKAFDCQRETGAVEVRVYVGDDNAAAQELYKQCGMSIVSKALYMKSQET